MWMTIADMHNKYEHSFEQKSDLKTWEEYFKKMSLVAILKIKKCFYYTVIKWIITPKMWQ